ncbi:MAG TPA: hypothetical protein VFX92_12515 [Candidatus Krumholzibacteria bacterium]|nr:hypothetical protein [Candidatus Krumholzibacteria bacterium]
MTKNFTTLPRLAVCMAIVGAMMLVVSGCAKKEAQEAETTQTTPATEEPAASMEMAAGPEGTYMAEVTPTEGVSSKITLVLNSDNTAMMAVEYSSGQPSVTQNGTWAMGEGENVINFTYGDATAPTTMSFSKLGEELHMMDGGAAAFGVSEVALKKMDVAADPHAGHSH